MDQSTESRFDSVLYCFLTVSFVDEKGKFAEAKDMTFSLTAWKFLMRCAFMHYAQDYPLGEKGAIGFVNLMLVRDVMLTTY